MTDDIPQRRILLYPAQVEFLGREEPFVCFVGGIGSGKSFVVCYDLLRRAKRGRLYMVIAPTFPMLRDSTLRSFFNVASMIGATFSFNKTEKQATMLRSGAEILFRSADDPDSLRGPNLSGVVLDEASIMDRETFNVSIGRLRQGGQVGFLRAAMTPKGREHWTYQTFATGNPDTYLVRSRTRDNPFLPADFESTVRRQYAAELAAQELEGEFLEGVDGYLFPDAWLSRAASLAESLKGKARRAVAIGVDPAEGGDKTAMAAVDELGLIELVSKRTPDTDMVPREALAFMRKHGVDPSKVCFDRGGGGKQHADRLRAQGYPVQTVAFGEAVSLEPRKGYVPFAERVDVREDRAVYKNRRAEMYGELRQLLDPGYNPRGFAIPREYDELRRQLAPIPLTYDNEGRLVLLPKNKRSAGSHERTLTDLIGHSPDEADACALAVHAMLHTTKRATAGAF